MEGEDGAEPEVSGITDGCHLSLLSSSFSFLLRDNFSTLRSAILPDVGLISVGGENDFGFVDLGRSLVRVFVLGALELLLRNRWISTNT